MCTGVGQKFAQFMVFENFAQFEKKSPESNFEPTNQQVNDMLNPSRWALGANSNRFWGKNQIFTRRLKINFEPTPQKLTDMLDSSKGVPAANFMQNAQNYSPSSVGYFLYKT